MNNNEEMQFKKFQSFILKNFKNIKNIFYGCCKVEKISKEGYDAKAYFNSGEIKYIQLTTMSNLIVKINDKIQHANKYNSSLKVKTIGDDEKIKDNINYFSNIGIKRKIIKKTNDSLLVSDTFRSIITNEEDLDKKYNLSSANLTNALYRALVKKIENTKKIEKHKEESSILVVIDESKNVFYSPTLIKTNNLKIGNYQDYFDFIFKIAVIESKFNKQNFFDGLQVYFHQAESDSSEEIVFLSENTHIKNVNKLDKNKMFFIQTVSMNKSYKGKAIININKNK